MNKTKIKRIAKENSFSISNKAIEKILKDIEQNTNEIINDAMRNAKFSGRKTIRIDDIEN
jgi:histone H3/H4|tara:strand:+ start:774 stop:953 length:180 start_codon:yes stop_codon:yes gene_type:complete